MSVTLPSAVLTAYEYATRGTAFAVRFRNLGVPDDGLTVLDQAARVARRYGPSHQLRSIEGIRKGRQG
ncbi:hypothetical protein GCM10010236_56510 [Streptomyces eurythermus]|nr:hypothetical protein GCM10010236_56510 [Streptomyces eurythermus]